MGSKPQKVAFHASYINPLEMVSDLPVSQLTGDMFLLYCDKNVRIHIDERVAYYNETLD